MSAIPPGDFGQARPRYAFLSWNQLLSNGNSNQPLSKTGLPGLRFCLWKTQTWEEFREAMEKDYHLVLKRFGKPAMVSRGESSANNASGGFGGSRDLPYLGRGPAAGLETETPS